MGTYMTYMKAKQKLPALLLLLLLAAELLTANYLGGKDLRRLSKVIRYPPFSSFLIIHCMKVHVR